MAACAADASITCREEATGQSPHCLSRREEMTAALLQVKSETYVSKRQEGTSPAEREASDQHKFNTVAKHEHIREPVLWQMIRPDPWKCDLLPLGDTRRFTCELGVDAE